MNQGEIPGTMGLASGPLQLDWIEANSDTRSQLLAQFADGNFYQTLANGSVCWGGYSLGHLVVRDANTIRAIAQVRATRLGRWWDVAYVRWGPCVHCLGAAWDLSAFRRSLEALMDRFVRRSRYVLRVIPNVFREDREAQPARLTLEKLGFSSDNPQAAYRNIRVDLTAPPEVLWKRLDQKWRNQLNAAPRNNLEVVEGSHGELFHRFLRLYDEMMARKRFETAVNPRHSLP